MPRLVWDEIGTRLYETGVRNCVLYKQNSDGAYPEGVAWNGITSIAQNRTGADANDIFADDIKYLTLRAIEKEEGTIEAYTYPEEFEECDGTAALSHTDSTTQETTVFKGVVVHQQPRKPFGLCFRTALGNDTQYDAHGYKLHLIYGCTCSPSEKTYNTINDSPEAITFSWSYTTTPVAVTGHANTSSLEIDSTKLSDAQRTAIENVLYGTGAAGAQDATTARLPLPDEVLSIIASA